MAALAFIENPRKVPRVMVTCPVGAVVGQDRFDSTTVDLSPRGCQLVAPRPHPRGTLVALLARSADADVRLQASGIVAWSSPHAPWRMGVAFHETSRAAGASFFEQVVAARPSLSGWRQVPTRIPLEASVWLARPPSRLVDFTPDEVAILRTVGSGCTVSELRAHLRDRWSTALRSLFSLLASGFLTLSLERSVPAATWAPLLNELEAELAVASLDDPLAGLAAAVAREEQDGRTLHALPADDEPYLPQATDGASGLDLDPELLRREPELELSAAARHPATRPPAAARAFQGALDELEAGRPGAALTLLRQALALAPGDDEIAKVLGDTAFRVS